jgi:hypothetical protein
MLGELGGVSLQCVTSDDRQIRGPAIFQALLDPREGEQAGDESIAALDRRPRGGSHVT